MVKKIVLSVVVASSIYAQDMQEMVKNTLQTNPILKQKILNIKYNKESLKDAKGEFYHFRFYSKTIL